MDRHMDCVFFKWLRSKIEKGKVIQGLGLKEIKWHGLCYFQRLRFILTKKDQGLGLSLEFEISRQGKSLLSEGNRMEKEKRRRRKGKEEDQGKDSSLL